MVLTSKTLLAIPTHNAIQSVVVVMRNQLALRTVAENKLAEMEIFSIKELLLLCCHLKMNRAQFTICTRVEIDDIPQRLANEISDAK